MNATTRWPRTGSGGPDHRHLTDGRVSGDGSLHLVGVHVLALTDDHVAEPARQEQIPLGVELPEVTGAEPAVGIGPEQVGRPHDDLAFATFPGGSGPLRSGGGAGRGCSGDRGRAGSRSSRARSDSLNAGRSTTSSPRPDAACSARSTRSGSTTSRRAFRFDRHPRSSAGVSRIPSGAIGRPVAMPASSSASAAPEAATSAATGRPVSAPISSSHSAAAAARQESWCPVHVSCASTTARRSEARCGARSPR